MPITGTDISSIFPIDSGPDGGSVAAANNLWPNGGQAASGTSIPAVSGTANPDYWLPIWSGEVIHAYDQYNIFEPMVMTETIESGTTKRFPITGTVGHKGVWNAGEELLGDTGISTPGWFDISLDQRPMAAFFELDDIHLMLTQWDYRAELARQAGLALANVRDKQIACMIAQGAFADNRNPFGTGYAGMNNSSNLILPPDEVFNALGNTKCDPDPVTAKEKRTNAALALLEYLERYMVHLQEIDVMGGEVYCAVTPQAFHDIRALGIARNVGDLVGGAGRPFFGGVAEAGGLGAPLNTGMFGLSDTLEYMGVKIIKSNHLGQLDQTWVNTAGVATAKTIGVTGVGTSGQKIGIVTDLGDAKYNFNFGQTTGVAATGGAGVPGTLSSGDTVKPVKALVWQKNAVCSMRLQGMKVETVKDVRRGTFFTVSSIMGGAGILRPELCGAIQGSYTVA
jgi:hypothetical protein